MTTQEDQLMAARITAFIVRVRRDGAGSGVVERVRDGLKEPFEDLGALPRVIARMLPATTASTPADHDTEAPSP